MLRDALCLEAWHRGASEHRPTGAAGSGYTGMEEFKDSSPSPAFCKQRTNQKIMGTMGGKWGGVWHKASVSDCLPLAAPIGLSPLLILTLCGPERVLVVSTEPPDDLSCLTTPGVGCPGDVLVPVKWGGGMVEHSQWP